MPLDNPPTADPDSSALDIDALVQRARGQRSTAQMAPTTMAMAAPQTAAPTPLIPPAQPAQALPDRIKDPRGIMRGTDPAVINWMNDAITKALPEGYTFEVSAGPVNHSPETYQGGVSQVPMGKALDGYIVDDKGNKLPHPLHLPPDSDLYKQYQKLGDAYIAASGGHGRWGGYYTDPDVMQFGTVMAGYPAGSRDPTRSGGGEAAVPMPPVEQAGFDFANFDRASYQQGMKNANDLYHKYTDEAQKEPSGSPERARALADAHAARLDAEKQYQALQKVPPVYKPADVMEQMGSPAVILALLGGLFAKQGLTAGLNAAGTAMQARNRQDFDAYKLGMEKWKVETENALTMSKIASEDIKDILDEKRLSYDEQRVKLESIARMYQMNHEMLIADPMNYYTTMINAQNAAITTKERIIKIHDAVTEQHDQDALTQKYVAQWQQSNPGQPVPPDVQAQAHNFARHEVAASTSHTGDIATQIEKEQAVRQLDEQFVKDHPGATQAEISQAHTDNVISIGNRFAQSLHPARSVNSQILQQYRDDFRKEHGRDPNADEMRLYNAGISQENAAARGFATGKQGDAVRSFNVAIDHLAELGRLTDALENHDIRAFNAAKNRLATEFGDPIPLEFDAAAPIVGGEVSKAVVGAVAALTDREEVRQALLNKNSPTELHGVIDVYKTLMAGQLNGYRRQFVNATGQDAAAFEKMLSDDAKRELEGVGKGSGAVDIPKASLDQLLGLVDQPGLSADQRRQIDERLKELGH